MATPSVDLDSDFRIAAANSRFPSKTQRALLTALLLHLAKVDSQQGLQLDAALSWMRAGKEGKKKLSRYECNCDVASSPPILILTVVVFFAPRSAPSSSAPVCTVTPVIVISRRREPIIFNKWASG